jgi:hypothetical protein
LRVAALPILKPVLVVILLGAVTLLARAVPPHCRTLLPPTVVIVAVVPEPV